MFYQRLVVTVNDYDNVLKNNDKGYLQLGYLCQDYNLLLSGQVNGKFSGTYICVLGVKEVKEGGTGNLQEHPAVGKIQLLATQAISRFNALIKCPNY